MQPDEKDGERGRTQRNPMMSTWTDGKEKKQKRKCVGNKPSALSSFGLYPKEPIEKAAWNPLRLNCIESSRLPRRSKDSFVLELKIPISHSISSSTRILRSAVLHINVNSSVPFYHSRFSFFLSQPAVLPRRRADA